jgi:hypothetical protein
MSLARVSRAALAPVLVRSGLVIAIAAGWVLPEAVLGQAWERSVFYAIGTQKSAGAKPEAPPPKDEDRSVRLYEVDSATLKIVRDLDLGPIKSGMMTGKGDAIVLTDGDRTITSVSAPYLAVTSQMDVPSAQGVNCAGQVFVHPLSGLAYFSCDWGSDTSGLLVVDTVRKSVVTSLRTSATLPGAYDAKQQLLYLLGDGRFLVILDPQNRVVGKVFASGTQVGDNRGIGSDVASVAPLPDGSLILATTNNFHPGSRPALLRYDPANRTVAHTWMDTETYVQTWARPDPQTHTELRGSRTVPMPVNCLALSRDGSRLFAYSTPPVRYRGDSPVHALLFEADNLNLVREEILPEPSSEWQSNGECFAPAPDGRGMWFFGQSGKIYRLDEHTGELIEEVKLPFHLVSLIREP